MIEIRKTGAFDKWFHGLKDMQARSRVNVRIRRLSLRNMGDVKPAGGGVSELRIDYGPGYRIYFVLHGKAEAILLGGGDKQSQARDIAAAKRLAKEI